jgi:hypothetical protein
MNALETLEKELILCPRQALLREDLSKQSVSFFDIDYAGSR